MIKRPRNINIPIARNTSNTLNLVCKYHSPLKGVRAAWKSGRFQDWHKESMSLECSVPEKQRCAQRQQRIGGVKTEAGLKGCWPMWEQSDIRKEDSDGLNKQHWGGGRDQ